MLKRMRSFLVVVMLLITATMSAQVTTASMSGKVTAQDEPIIGATIVAIHEPSGTRYGTVTNVSGQFNLQGMRTGGPYKVEITYVGYQSAIYKGIQLSLGENYVLNVSLKESSELLDEVVVTASKNSNMKSDRAGAITNIGEEQMAMLPAINRSMNDVMRLTPQGQIQEMVLQSAEVTTASLQSQSMVLLSAMLSVLDLTCPVAVLLFLWMLWNRSLYLLLRLTFVRADLLVEQSMP